jgi:signal peptidase I
MAKQRAEEKGSIAKMLRDIIIILLVVLGIHSFVAKPFYIPSDSMMPLLRSGDRLIVSKYPYGWSYSSISFHLAPKGEGRLFAKLPERGDVVVLEHPVLRVDYIKRVIGLPGDRLSMKDGLLSINGTPVRHQVQPMTHIEVDQNVPSMGSSLSRFVTHDAQGRSILEVPIVRETLPNGVSFDTIDMGNGYPGDNFDEITVPDGHVFLMGDNRDGSADSRFPTMSKGLGGPVPFEAISGRAEFITFSTNGSAEALNPISWWHSLRGHRAGITLRPQADPAA